LKQIKDRAGKSLVRDSDTKLNDEFIKFNEEGKFAAP